MLKQTMELTRSIKTARQQWESNNLRGRAGSLAQRPGGKFGGWPLRSFRAGQLAARLRSSLQRRNRHLAGISGQKPGHFGWIAGEVRVGRRLVEGERKRQEQGSRRTVRGWLHGYLQALPGLSGLKKENVLNRLSEVSDRTAIKGAILVFTFEPNCFFNSGDSRHLLDLSGHGNHAVVKKAESVPGKAGSECYSAMVRVTSNASGPNRLMIFRRSRLASGSSRVLEEDRSIISSARTIGPTAASTASCSAVLPTATSISHSAMLVGMVHSPSGISNPNHGTTWRAFTTAERVTIFIDGVSDVTKETPRNDFAIFVPVTHRSRRF